VDLRWSRAAAIAVACAYLASADVAAAQNAFLHLLVTSAGSPVAGATVVVNGTSHRTDDRGEVAIDIAPGTVQIVVSKEGLAPGTVTLELRADERRTLTIALEPQGDVATLKISWDVTQATVPIRVAR